MGHHLATRARQNARRIADGGDIVANIVQHHGTRADRGPFADLHLGNHDRAGADVRALAHLDMPAEGDMRRDVNEVADAVVVIDTSGGVDDYVAADDGVGLDDGAMRITVPSPMVEDAATMAVGCRAIP